MDASTISLQLEQCHESVNQIKLQFDALPASSFNFNIVVKTLDGSLYLVTFSDFGSGYTKFTSNRKVGVQQFLAVKPAKFFFNDFVAKCYYNFFKICNLNYYAIHFF